MVSLRLPMIIFWNLFLIFSPFLSYFSLRELPDWSVRVTWCRNLGQKEVKIAFTVWRETINRFQKKYHEARRILLLDHPLLVCAYMRLFITSSPPSPPSCILLHRTFIYLVSLSFRQSKAPFQTPRKFLPCQLNSKLSLVLWLER